jgi:carbon storage regulator
MEKLKLILTRNQNESVVIDDDIKITVLSDNYGQVKLGIEAPQDVEIWREKIYDKLEEVDSHLTLSALRGAPKSVSQVSSACLRVCLFRL